jgi:hypothetical protein
MRRILLALLIAIIYSFLIETEPIQAINWPFTTCGQESIHFNKLTLSNQPTGWIDMNFTISANATNNISLNQTTI